MVHDLEVGWVLVALVLVCYGECCSEVWSGSSTGGGRAIETELLQPCPVWADLVDPAQATARTTVTLTHHRNLGPCDSPAPMTLLATDVTVLMLVCLWFQPSRAHIHPMPAIPGNSSSITFLF